MEQTNFYHFICICLLLMDNTLIILFQIFRLHLEKNTQFLFHNLLWVISLDIFFGLYVPLKHIILSRHSLPSLWWSSTSVKIVQFYVRPPCISPRRSVARESHEKSDKQHPFVFLRKSSKNKRLHTKFRNRVKPLDQTFQPKRLKNQLGQPYTTR